MKSFLKDTFTNGISEAGKTANKQKTAEAALVSEFKVQIAKADSKLVELTVAAEEKISEYKQFLYSDKPDLQKATKAKTEAKALTESAELLEEQIEEWKADFKILFPDKSIS